MANKSDLTRREQVLRYLQDHADEWVDGPELANAQVGGSEGLKRVRELRADIIMELAWRNGLMDVAMPFMIQTVFDYNAKLGAVTAKLEAMEKKQSDEDAARAAMEEEEQELYNPVIATNLLAPPPGMGMGGGNMMGGGMGMDNGMMGGGMGGGMGMDNGMGGTGPFSAAASVSE